MSEDEDGWKFELDDLSAEDEEAERPGPGPVERESVEAENAVFVAAGVLLTVGTLVLFAL